MSLGLAPKQVEEIVGRGRSTLLNWRRQGIGPPFYTFRGRIYYRREDIDAWIAAHRVETTHSHIGRSVSHDLVEDRL